MIYQRADVCAFRKTKEKWGGFSNMAGGFPLRVNGIDIRTSEALYQALRFPQLPDLQRAIIEERSPMAAKMLTKPRITETRPDWNSIRVAVMYFALQAKLVCNPVTFGALLDESGDRDIVEDSARDDFWGAVPVPPGDALIGENMLGRLLMILRGCYRRNPEGATRFAHSAGERVLGLLLYGEPVGNVYPYEAA